jgi:hypothetical protein
VIGVLQWSRVRCQGSLDHSNDPDQVALPRYAKQVDLRVDGFEADPQLTRTWALNAWQEMRADESIEGKIMTSIDYWQGGSHEERLGVVRDEAPLVTPMLCLLTHTFDLAVFENSTHAVSHQRYRFALCLSVWPKSALDQGNHTDEWYI